LLPEALEDNMRGLRAVLEKWCYYEINCEAGRLMFDTSGDKVVVRIYPRNVTVQGLEDVPACLQVLEAAKNNEGLARLVRLAEIAEVVLMLTK
jgi:hypothetical protein